MTKYHCNHGFGKSLADYVVKDNGKKAKCEINDKERSYLGVMWEMRKKYKSELKKLNQKGGVINMLDSELKSKRG